MLFQAGILAGAAVFLQTAGAAESFKAAAGDCCQKQEHAIQQPPGGFALETPLAVQNAAQSAWLLKGRNPESGQTVGGTGFFLSPRLLVTNFHILESFGRAALKDIVLSQNGKKSGMRINRLIAASAIEDTAVLETDRAAPFYLTLREKPLAAADDDVFVLGYPGGSFHVLKKTGPLKNFEGFMDFHVNYSHPLPGLSGAPAVDSKGHVLGIFHIFTANFAAFTKWNRLKSILDGETGARCGGAPREKCLDEALRRASDRAKAGEASAQFMLGYRHLLDTRSQSPADAADAGEGESFNKSVYWISKAAEQGMAMAQHRLGSMYLHGEGARRDFKKAAFYLMKAAEQGYAPSENRLGLMHLTGYGGVPADVKKAAFYLMKAAEQGDAQAQYNLGLMHLLGHGAPADFKKAAFYLMKAAEQGDAQAQHYLGLMHLHGDGVEQSLEKSAAFLKRAARNGHEKSLEILLDKDGPFAGLSF